MYYLIGNEFTNSFCRVPLEWLLTNGDRYAIWDRDTFVCRVLTGVEVYQEIQAGKAYFLDAGYLSEVSGILFFSYNCYVKCPGFQMHCLIESISLRKDRGRRVLAVKLRNGFVYIDDRKCMGITATNLSPRWMYNLGHGVYRLVINCNLMADYYILDIMVDLDSMQFLFLECKHGDDVWELSVPGLGYSSRRDWFLGRLAKKRLLGRDIPVYSI